MANQTDILARAKSSLTKAAWSDLFSEFSEDIQHSGQSKLVGDLFRLLKTDKQSINYGDTIWSTLLKACINSWDADMALEIANYISQLPSANVLTLVAQIYLEAGQPTKARESAQRALRFKNLSELNRLQLKMLVANSNSDEGNNHLALRLYNQLASEFKDSNLSPVEKAQFLNKVARMLFFLGQYRKAATQFKEASKFFKLTDCWEEAATSIFNTAACYGNAGEKNPAITFKLVEEARSIAEQQNLPGVFSHCEAFYGFTLYATGDFIRARDHFNKAMNYLPKSEKGYRRLHIISMIALTNLVLGRFVIAQRYGEETLRLAALDQSNRNKPRYVSLEAELKWHNGDLKNSFLILEAMCNHIETHTINTLEELFVMSIYIRQCALLGVDINVDFTINDQLKQKNHTWVEWKITLADLELNKNPRNALSKFLAEAEKAKLLGQKYNYALALSGACKASLRSDGLSSNGVTKLTHELIAKFEQSLTQIGETTLGVQLIYFGASVAYRAGRFDDVKKLLLQGRRYPQISYVDSFLLSSWMKVIEGKTPRYEDKFHLRIFNNMTKLLFSPKVELKTDRSLIISQRYKVDLSRYPSIAEFLKFLFSQKNFSSTPEIIQLKVWQQSLNTQSWQQKIRNTIKRIRSITKETLIPIIVQDEDIRLNYDVIDFYYHNIKAASAREEVIRLVSTKAVSSKDISQHLDMSISSVKRLLKGLVDEGLIKTLKEGRNIKYQSARMDAVTSVNK